MKVTIPIPMEIFKNIEPEGLRDYLKAHGWQFNRPFLDNATIWLKQELKQNEDEFEILLPNRKNLGDYATRIYEVIETLALAENRSQLEIIGSLITNYPNITIQAVVTHITSPKGNALSGSITLLGVVVDKLRPITTLLTNHEYIIAIKAYTERLPVLCKGDLIKENETFILKNLQEFRLDETNHYQEVLR